MLRGCRRAWRRLIGGCGGPRSGPRCRGASEELARGFRHLDGAVRVNRTEESLVGAARLELAATCTQNTSSTNWRTPRFNSASTRICRDFKGPAIRRQRSDGPRKGLVAPPGFEPGSLSYEDCKSPRAFETDLVDTPGTAPGSSGLQPDAFTRLAWYPKSCTPANDLRDSNPHHRV